MIAVFTKFDGMVVTAYQSLVKEKVPHKEAKKQASQRAESMLEELFLEPLKATKFPPARHLSLQCKDFMNDLGCWLTCSTQICKGPTVSVLN